MQSYRLVPVGDKIVVIVDRDDQGRSTDQEAECIGVLPQRAVYYDFRIGKVNGNESLDKVAAALGGYSHE
jgi:hypothetical protein